MKILVTGANGYLGQGIVKRLSDRSCEVIATDLRTERIDHRAVSMADNLFAIKDPYHYFNMPDVVLHLAWRDGFRHYSDAHITDLPEHYEFIKKLIQCGVKKISVMGSMHEAGFFEGPVKEDSPCRPLSLYGISKNALRDAVFMLAGLHEPEPVVQWLRGFYIVGNSESGSSVFSKIAASARQGEKEFPFTSGQNQYDFMDYDDFCEAVVSAVMQDEVTGIINICSGKPEKLSDRVERFIRENGYDIRLKYGAFPDRPYDSKAVWGDSAKIDRIMNRQMRM